MIRITKPRNTANGGRLYCGKINIYARNVRDMDGAEKLRMLTTRFQDRSARIWRW